MTEKMAKKMREGDYFTWLSNKGKYSPSLSFLIFYLHFLSPFFSSSSLMLRSIFSSSSSRLGLGLVETSEGGWFSWWNWWS